MGWAGSLSCGPKARACRPNCMVLRPGKDPAMFVGVAMFCTDYAIAANRAGERAGGSRLRIALAARAQPYPLDPPVALSGRRRAAQEILRRHGPLRRAGRRCGRHDAPEDRHRHLPGAAARPDPDRQVGRHRRPDLEGQVPVRGRRGLECRRDGRPRHRLQEPQQGHARAHRGHARDLDQDQARVSAASSSSSGR